MAGTIKDYLSQTTADYTATQLTITPQKVLIEDGDIKQKTIEFDDTNVGVLTRSTSPVFYFYIDWPTLSSADSNTILDMYFDSSKANGRARTFEFPHPMETSNTYIVRFWCKLSRSVHKWRGIENVILRVEGYK